MRAIWRRVRAVAAGASCVGLAAAIASYSRLVSPLEHVREWARSGLPPETSADVLLRLACWLVLGALVARLGELLRAGDRRGG
jgi:hypothetical protein